MPAFQVADTSQGPYRAPLDEFMGVRVNPTGELPAAMQPMEANDELNRRDGFQLTEVDQRIYAAHGTQLVGPFLIDRRGIIRWTHIEARERMADLAALPTEEEIPAAARALPREPALCMKPRSTSGEPAGPVAAEQPHGCRAPAGVAA